VTDAVRRQLNVFLLLFIFVAVHSEKLRI
jgi:hypothetical protein